MNEMHAAPSPSTAQPGSLPAGSAPYPIQMRSLEWLGLSLRVPCDWELVRHSLNTERGSLRFVDRRRERLIVSWTQTKGAPDLQRLVSDFKSQQLVREEHAAVEPFRFESRWRGIRQRGLAVGNCDMLTRAVCFDAASSRLIEAVVISANDDKSQRRLVQRILADLEARTPANEARRWRAFGLAVTAPPGFRLVKTAIKPADASFEFERCDPESGAAIRTRAFVRRLGMAEAWFDGDLRRVVKSHAPKVQFEALAPFEHQGQGAVKAEGIEPGPLLWRWLGRLRRQRTLAWLAREEDAVYEVSTLSPTRQPVEPSEFEVEGEKATV